MPSLDERREVAARMRRYTYYARMLDENNSPKNKVGNGNSMFRNIAQAVGGGCANMTDTYEETLRKLIDLIEPEPERTTTRHGKFKTKYGNRVPLCECCGYSIGDKRYNYCPNCGAKVVD